MIAVDTSALIAIFWKEPEAEALLSILVEQGGVISAATRLEAYAVCVRRRGQADAEDLDSLIVSLNLETAAFDLDQYEIARRAYARFGRGGETPVLNFGDCFAYALAKSRGVPLLFKGDDFGRTDIVAAF